MATLSEVLRSSVLHYVVLGGAAGLGREVRRILHVRPTDEMTGSPGIGDLIIYSSLNGSPTTSLAADRTLVALLSSGVAGILTDVAPGRAVVDHAEQCGAPLLSRKQVTSLAWEADELERNFELLRSRLPMQQQELEQDLSDLARSGAMPAMVLQRLVETTGKTGLLQAPNALVQHIQVSVQQHLETEVVRQAVRESDPAARRWMLEKADPTVAPVLYLELSVKGLVRLVAPVWIDGRIDAAVSLLSRPDELIARDRAGLMAAARAIAMTSLETTLDPQVSFTHRSFGAVAAIVLRAPGAGLDAVAHAVRERIDFARGALRLGREDVRVWLPYRSVDEWYQCVAEWHAHLSNDIGALSIGHALAHRNPEGMQANHIVVQAAEAALVGERLFGPGQVTSYADAQLAKFLLTQHGTSELQALYERAVGRLAIEDLQQHGELVSTLEVYCETYATKRTAERLGVHRNTVLYRLKRIEEITLCDLDDGPTRLLFQFGLLAGRLLRKGSAGPQSISGAWARTPPLKTAV